MNVTQVKIFQHGTGLQADQSLKAYASITFDDMFVVRGLKVINGKKGLFVVMPSRKMADGTFKDIAHPLNNETRKLIEEKVLTGFKDAAGAPAAGMQ